MRSIWKVVAITTMLVAAASGGAQAAQAQTARALAQGREAQGRIAEGRIAEGRVVSARQWRVVLRTHSATAGPLISVAAPARDDAWAVGSSGDGSTRKPLILQWNGVRWRPVSVPGTAGLTPGLVTAASPRDVWILGAQGKRSFAWIGDAAGWLKTNLPGPFQDGTFATVSRTDAWGSVFAICVTVTGAGSGSSSCTTTISHWNGKRWSSRGLGGLVQDIAVAGGHAWFLDLTHLQAVASNHPTGVPVLYEATGTTLKKISTAAAPLMATGASLAVSPSGQIWVLGHLNTANGPVVLLHRTGQRWTPIAVPARAGGGALVVGRTLTYDGGSGVWAGPFAHWTGQRWDNANPGGNLTAGVRYALTAMARIQGTASLWAVGWVARTAADSTRDTLIARH